MKTKLSNWAAGITAALALTLSAGSAGAACVKGANTFPLIAGQNMTAGYVSVQVDGDNLVVTYTTTGDWKLGYQHLWVGDNMNNIPKNKSGNPVPGQFPYKGDGPFIIPLADLGFSCPGADKTFYLAAHAEVWLDNGDGTMTGETAWSDGAPIVPGKGNWGMFSEFELTCNCSTGPGDDDQRCETAFAKLGSSICFSELDPSFERWGWTTLLEPQEDAYVMALYAGAAQCDPDKGTLVGAVSVSYNNGEADVDIVLADGLTLDETHIYIGSEPTPIKNGKPTVAPGQYTATFSGLEGPIYIIVHAVVCGNY